MGIFADQYGPAFTTRLAAMGAGLQGKDPSKVWAARKSEQEGIARKEKITALMDNMGISGNQRSILDMLPQGQQMTSLYDRMNQGEARGRTEAANAAFAERWFPQQPSSFSNAEIPVTQNPAGLPQSVIDAVDRVDSPYVPGLDNVNYGAIGIRNKPLSDQYRANLSDVVSQMGPEYGVRVNSAGQPSSGPGRTGGHRHDVDGTGRGNTSDFALTKNGQVITPTSSPEDYERLMTLGAGVFPGIGHYDNFVHMGGGTEAAWGPDKTSGSLDPRYAAAINRGRSGGGQPQGDAKAFALMQEINNPDIGPGRKQYAQLLLDAHMKSQQPVDPMDEVNLRTAQIKRDQAALDYDQDFNSTPDREIIEIEGRKYWKDSVQNGTPELVAPNIPQPETGFRDATPEEAQLHGAVSGQVNMETNQFTRDPAAPNRETAPGRDKRLRFIDDGSLVFPNMAVEQSYDWKGNNEERDDWEGLASNKEFNKQSAAFGRVVASSENPSPAGDLALIFNYMKVLDPGSTVREGEFATAQNSGGVDSRVRALYGQVMEGTRLSGAQRADFVDRAHRLYKEAESGYMQRYNQRLPSVQARNLNPEFVLTDFKWGGELPVMPDPDEMTPEDAVKYWEGIK